MESRAKLVGHSIHPMLIVLPLGLLSASVLFDIVHFLVGGSQWGLVAFWDIAAGVVGGLLAAAFGLVDWFAIPSRTRAKSVGALHGLGNVVVVVLFAVSWLVRFSDPGAPSRLGFILSLIGVILASITGWLGGELVERLGVGVDPDAGLNATSSLSGRRSRREIA